MTSLPGDPSLREARNQEQLHCKPLAILIPGCPRGCPSFLPYNGLPLRGILDQDKLLLNINTSLHTFCYGMKRMPTHHIKHNSWHHPIGWMLLEAEAVHTAKVPQPDMESAYEYMYLKYNVHLLSMTYLMDSYQDHAKTFPAWEHSDNSPQSAVTMATSPTLSTVSRVLDTRVLIKTAGIGLPSNSTMS